MRMNDGKTDPAGRFWAGTMRLDGRPGRGALYRLDGRDAATPVIEPVSISNGLGWSRDGERMFYIDSPTRIVRQYAFDAAAGALGESSILVDTSPYPGLPDGLAVDAEDNLWIAFWGGGAVRSFSGADGTLLEVIHLPVTRPTSCTFGGRDLGRLLITTARAELSEAELAEQPLAGSVLTVEPGVAGMPPTFAEWDHGGARPAG
jgi:sugar lactone lactonase YvrE